MQLPHPSTLSEVIADGAIVQADISARIGHIDQVKLVRGTEQEVQVALLCQGRNPSYHQGRIVAEIREDRWQWRESMTDFDIPELQGEQEASEHLIAAARTLHGNAPVLLAPDRNGVTWVVALQGEFRQQAPREALITGLAALPAEIDLQRALLGFAAARGLGVRIREEQVSFSDGTTLLLADGRVTRILGGLSLAEIRADAHYLSIEHQLLLEGTLPQANSTFNDSGVMLHSATGASIQTQADVIATVEGNTWTWAWADPSLPSPRAMELQRFGIDNGIPELFTPSLPLEMARESQLWVVAKPVLHRWVHTTIPQGRGYAVLLIDAPELRLPDASFNAAQATLAHELPTGLDPQRARRAYAQARGLSLQGEWIEVAGQLL